MKQRFVVLTATNDLDLQNKLNDFAKQLPPTARIRRTQLAQSTTKEWAAGEQVERLFITALVNYEVETDFAAMLPPDKEVDE